MNGTAERYAPLPSPGGRCPEGADEGRPRSGRWRGAQGNAAVSFTVARLHTAPVGLRMTGIKTLLR